MLEREARQEGGEALAQESEGLRSLEDDVDRVVLVPGVEVLQSTGGRAGGSWSGVQAATRGALEAARFRRVQVEAGWD